MAQVGELEGAELARYGRQIILPGFGVAAQQRLKASRVLVLGAGGLGSPAALYLAAAGVGTLGLADFDRVETHNLHRQILHGTSDANASRSKLQSAAKRLQDLNPHVSLRLHTEGLQPASARELFTAYDLVVDGTDNFPTRYLANDAAFLAQKPLVYGAVFQFEGQVSLFDPHRGGPCYRCLFPQMPGPGEVPNCAEAGVLGALCGVIGSLQALQAIRFLADLEGAGLRGKLLCLDALEMRPRTLQIKPDPDCPLCGSHRRICDIQEKNYPVVCQTPAIEHHEENQKEKPMFGFLKKASQNDAHPMEITVDAAHELLQSPEPPALLDVREDFEVAIGALPNHIHIPLGDLGDQTPSVEADQPLIVYCHHGMRSLRAARLLRAKGFSRATSLKGGIDAWSLKVDPSVPRY
jgi:sulfur-carrier protein adenylyltransferase/sulfurtransferase